MLSRLTLKIAAALIVSLSAALLVAEARVSRQRQPSRRVTNPVDPQRQPTPDPNEPRLVSSADEQERETPRTARDRRNRQQQSQQQRQDDEARRALEELSEELTRLNKKVDDIEKQRKVDLVMERLARAEQRAEAVQAQLRDTMEKEANLQARLDQLEEQSRPENIDRQLATLGSFRPDAERERLRAQYENEKRRTRELIDVNARQRQRLEQSLATADQLVERLRAQLDEETRRELEAGAAGGDAGTTGTARPAASPVPTPTPPTR